MRDAYSVGRQFLALAILFWSLLFLSQRAIGGGSPNDKEALSGLKDVKVIFDITTGNAKKLLSRLDLIKETHDSMMQQGVKPHFVLAFRGPASLLVQRDESKIKLEDLEVAKKIAEKIKTLSESHDYKLEQCAVAQRYLKLKNEDTLPEIEVIGNSWISLAAYQNKGYAYIPVD